MSTHCLTYIAFSSKMKETTYVRVKETEQLTYTINMCREKKMGWPDTSPPIANFAPSVLNTKHLWGPTDWRGGECNALRLILKSS